MAVKKQQYELTQEGLKKLEIELEDLKTVKREENLKALKEAREQGDLSENADYDAARNEQARIESRIVEIEVIIKNVKIIKVSTDDGSVNIGKKVEVEFLEKSGNARFRTFDLVGTIEADPASSKISIESPIGKALKGHMLHDEVTVRSETGKSFPVKIVKIS